MGFREVSVVEVREVLRAWLEGAGLRKVAERAGVDRKTARRYVAAAEAAGLVREDGSGAVTDELVGAVVEAVRPVRPNGHGAAWEQLGRWEEQITGWVAGGEGAEPLSIVKIEELLARQGCRVPYRTLHRFAVERCGFGVRSTTVRVADGEPGVECQVDFAQMGLLLDPETGKKRRVHALIFTAVVSRHMFVWLTYSQTLAAVIESLCRRSSRSRNAGRSRVGAARSSTGDTEKRMKLRGLLAHLDARSVPAPSSLVRVRSHRRRDRPPLLLPQEIQAILDGCAVFDAVTGQWVGNLRDRLLFALLAESGMRIGEALGLRISDFVMGRGGTPYLEIVPRLDNANGARVKMMRPRRVYVGSDLERLFADYLTHVACRAGEWGGRGDRGLRAAGEPPAASAAGPAAGGDRPRQDDGPAEQGDRPARMDSALVPAHHRHAIAARRRRHHRHRALARPRRRHHHADLP